MTKGKIALLYGPNDLRIEEVTVPDPRPDQILIKMKATGICGSDVECFEGKSKEGRYDIAPYTPGHEWAGRGGGGGQGCDHHQGGRQGDRRLCLALLPL